MKITGIDVIPILPRLVPRYAGREIWAGRINHRTLYRVRADNGLVGYGDHRLAGPSRESLQPLIGRDPFEFVNNDFDPGLGGALYDLMGKALDVPAFRLMGPKVRDAVSVAAWTSQASPDDFGSETARAARQGYGILKMHTAPFFDVLEQTEAAEAVAPPGFRLHYDLNGNRTLTTLLHLVRQFEAHHPIVGYLEDPFPKADRDAWCRLREQSHIPLLFHVSATHPLLPEVTAGVADTYLFSGVSIGRTLTGGAACACANAQVLLQLTGGTLTKALALHMAAVLPTATGHSIHLDDQYEDDVTIARLPVVAGASKVPDGPGLGVDVDEDAVALLAERAAEPPVEASRCLAILRVPGRMWYTTPPPDVVRLTGREEGDLRGVRADLWPDDGSDDFAQMYDRVACDGAVEADAEGP